MEKCTYTLFTINFFLSFLFVSFYMCCDSFCHWKVRFSHWNNKSYMRFYEVRRIPFQLRGHSLCAISYSFFLCSWWDVYGRLTSNLSRCKIFFVFFSLLLCSSFLYSDNNTLLLYQIHCICCGFFPSLLESRCLHLSIIAIFCLDFVNTSLFRAQGTSHSFLLYCSSSLSPLTSFNFNNKNNTHTNSSNNNSTRTQSRTQLQKLRSKYKPKIKNFFLFLFIRQFTYLFCGHSQFIWFVFFCVSFQFMSVVVDFYS